MTTQTTILSQYLTPAAIARLAEQYDLLAIEEAWRRGDYGTLHATDTGETLGAATLEQAIQSYEAGYEGHAEMYLPQRGPISAYVQP